VCGIAGVFATGSNPVCVEDLDHFVDAMRHRGPDGHGTWMSESKRMGLAHNRLAIIDLDDRAAQPMSDADGWTIVFNGEIYNYKSLRVELSQLGFRFQTSSDTEVVLNAYRCWGEAALPRLRGMFAFAVAAPHRDEIFLARDPFGIKPLYFSADDEYLRFASEITALRPFSREMASTPALIDLFVWGNIAAPNTIFADIKALEPGHWARIDSGGMALRQWADPAQDLDLASSPVTEDASIELIRDSTRLHLESDVEVGVFLSSGVDSSVLASHCARFGNYEIKTLTIQNPLSDESRDAALFAESIGSQHTTVTFSDNEMASLLSSAVSALDQPSLDGINSYFVAKAAAEAGLKVAISGVGGDELFGGYGSFARVPRLRTLSSIARMLRVNGGSTPLISSRLGWDRSSKRGQLAWLSTYLPYPWGPYLLARGVLPPHEVANLLSIPVETVQGRIDERLQMRNYTASPNWITRLEANQYLQPQLLRDIDAVSMASSIEVRTPLVDAQLYSEIAGLPVDQRLAGPSKSLLKATSFNSLQFLAASKKGFTIPIEKWMRTGALKLNQTSNDAIDTTFAQHLLAESLNGRRPWTHGWLIHVLNEHLQSAN